MEFLDVVEVENKVNIIFGAIYLIKNNINGKCYVGQQKTKNKTFYAVNKYFGSGTYIRNAIKKYGKENFSKYYLCLCNSAEELDEKEKYYIKLLDTKNNGYNQTNGGDHYRQGQNEHKAEVNEKRRQQMLNAWKDPEYREKVMKNRYGFHHSEETKKKMSKAASNSWTPERHKQAHESGNYKGWTNQDPEKIRKARTGTKMINKDGIQKSVKQEELDKWLNEGWKLGRLPMSAETRKRMSESAKHRKVERKRDPKTGHFI